MSNSVLLTNSVKTFAFSNRLAGVFLFAFLFIFAGSVNTVHGQTACTSGQVVINEVFTEGGLAGATFRNDFVELFNRSNTACSLAGFSIQIASATANNFPTVITFPAGTIIPAGRTFLIQFGSGGTNGMLLPTPDFTIATDLPSSGKIALVASSTSLTGNCASNLANSLDLVGFGASANCFEGPSPAASGSLTTSIQRNTNGFDTNNNATDFNSTTAPSPRNSTMSPTAAQVKISGRVTLNQRGVSAAFVYLTDQNGETRTTLTSSFGYFRFKDVQVGETYILNVVSKRHSFQPQVITVTEEMLELNISAETK
jgi:hypothetical protein